jgi:hypothetical protein
MKINKKLAIIALTSIVTFQASAVPWCHRGTIVTVANVSWNGSTNVAMSSGIAVPPGVSDAERYQVFYSTNNYCQAYAGGGGPTWGWSVPGAGSVSTFTTGPYVLTNTVNNYDLNMGVSFNCKKCYSIAPYYEHKEMKHLEPMPGTEGNAEYNEEVRER